MNIAYLLPDCAAAHSLAKKLAKNGRPGAIIFINEAEMIVFKNSERIETPPANTYYFDDNLLETGE